MQEAPQLLLGDVSIVVRVDDVEHLSHQVVVQVLFEVEHSRHELAVVDVVLRREVYFLQISLRLGVIEVPLVLLDKFDQLVSREHAVIILVQHPKCLQDFLLLLLHVHEVDHVIPQGALKLVLLLEANDLLDDGLLYGIVCLRLFEPVVLQQLSGGGSLLWVFVQHAEN